MVQTMTNLNSETHADIVKIALSNLMKFRDIPAASLKFPVELLKEVMIFLRYLDVRWEKVPYDVLL
jgi:hypothetical protein